MNDDKLRLTEGMARAMLATAPKYKPVYLIRAYKIAWDFEIVWPGDDQTVSQPSQGKAGDYITINYKDHISVVEASAVESDFKMILPRKPKVVTE